MTTLEPRGRKPTFALQDHMHLAMRTAGLTPADMAERLDVSRVTVWGWLHGRSRPRTPTLIAWALLTDCDYYWLVGQDPPSGKPQVEDGITDNKKYPDDDEGTHSYRQDLVRTECMSVLAVA